MPAGAEALSMLPSGTIYPQTIGVGDAVDSGEDVGSGEVVTCCDPDWVESDAVAGSELDDSGVGLVVGDVVDSGLTVDEFVGLGSGERVDGDSDTEALSLTVGD